MSYHSFEDLKVWQRGCQLAVDVYELLRHSKDFAYKDQMVRSSLSIPSNIAEGSERNSPKEFARFLHIAKGSSAELRTQLIIGEQLKIIDSPIAERLITECTELSAMLQGLAYSLKT